MAVSIHDDTYMLEGRFILSNPSSEAGILFFTDEEGANGYAATVTGGMIFLKSLENGVLTEISRKAVEAYTDGAEICIRVEVNDKLVKIYYLDDMPGVEPWPEFEYELQPTGTCVKSYFTANGGEKLSLQVKPYTPKPVTKPTYTNPVLYDVHAADPGVLYHNGTYYLYCTCAPVGYYVHTSKDLVHWTNEGYCIESAWGLTRWYWAPEVVERNGKFYMIMSVDEHIGIASADSPKGPFVPQPNWIFSHSIDGHIFIDDDGRAYLYYVSWREGKEYGIYAMELNSDMVTPKYETETLILKPETAWETSEGRVTEGPFMLKHKGKYYLTYSAPGYTSHNYGIGYAVSDTPLGKFVRYGENPILSYTSVFHGPGHHSFTTNEAGDLIIVYHVHQAPGKVHPRKVCIDRARFAETARGIDRLEIYGPTHTPQEIPVENNIVP